MKFSVVIPLYNKEPYIGFTLQSVLAQSFADFEVLVVDDGSSDAGPHIVASLAQADPRVRLVQQPNGGVSAARNAGIAAARGEWVAFLDADDWWHPEYLNQQMRSIQANPSVAMSATQLRKIPDTENWSPLPWGHVDLNSTISLIDNLPSRWMESIPFFTSSVVISRTLLARIQPCFAIGESHGEDLDLWFRVAEITNISHIAVPFVAYRTAGRDSLTSKNTKLVLAPFLQRMKDRSNVGGAAFANRKSISRLIIHFQISLAREAISAGNRLQSLSLLWQGKRAALSKRWLFTLFMILFFSPSIVQRWKRWRYDRVAAK